METDTNPERTQGRHFASYVGRVQSLVADRNAVMSSNSGLHFASLMYQGRGVAPGHTLQ